MGCVLSQLPHMPHIGESLMKRSLRQVDLRDMSLGQLQVITNDLHSQIQGEVKVHVQQSRFQLNFFFVACDYPKLSP